MSNYTLYKVTLSLRGSFGTPLKGDTIFGHFCWQCANDKQLLKIAFRDFLEKYRAGSPAFIFSSAFSSFNDGKVIFKRPPLPSKFSVDEDVLPEKIKQRKEDKKKIYFVIGDDLKLLPLEYQAFKEFNFEFHDDVFKTVVYRNKINRLTNSTGTSGDGFAPYGVDKFYYSSPKQVIFVLLDETLISKDNLKLGLERIGSFGYGKDASIGQGRFNIDNIVPLSVPKGDGKNLYYTLSPLVLAENDNVVNAFYLPLTRFGKHGDLALQGGSPFKNPILMFDDCALLKTGNVLEQPFVGKALENLSNNIPETVAQGYSIVLPWLGE